jgi:hypothetical protein
MSDTRYTPRPESDFGDIGGPTSGGRAPLERELLRAPGRPADADPAPTPDPARRPPVPGRRKSRRGPPE